MSKLYSNKSNLLPKVTAFVADNDNVTIYSAFIKDSILKELIKHSRGNIKQIIARFRKEDFESRSSDISIYFTCKENNITLYRNENLHAKCLFDLKGGCVLGSANITNSGLLNTEEANWELNTEVNNIDKESRVLLNRILLESTIVTQEWIDHMNSQLADGERAIDKHEKYSEEDKEFLLTQLPMCNHPELLWEIFFEDRLVHNEELESAAHDMALYDLPTEGVSKDEFFELLRTKFNEKLFTKRLIEFIKKKEKCWYHDIVSWVTRNCTSVPTPRSWELKEKKIVNILYEWICCFNEDVTYTRKYPNGSDIIEYTNYNR